MSKEGEHFARAIVMPRAHFEESVRAMGGVSPKEAVKVRALALKYHVEPQDVRSRLRDLKAVKREERP
jgi:hypothetical protein